MPKVFEIIIRALDKPSGSDEDIKKMKVGAILYLKQLGISQ